MWKVSEWVSKYKWVSDESEWMNRSVSQWRSVTKTIFTLTTCQSLQSSEDLTHDGISFFMAMYLKDVNSGSMWWLITMSSLRLPCSSPWEWSLHWNQSWRGQVRSGVNDRYRGRTPINLLGLTSQSIIANINQNDTLSPVVIFVKNIQYTSQEPIQGCTLDGILPLQTDKHWSMCYTLTPSFITWPTYYRWYLLLDSLRKSHPMSLRFPVTIWLKQPPLLNTL